MYKVVYFEEDPLMVTSQDFDETTKARQFAASKDWAVIVEVTTSRTIVDITP